MNKIVACLWGLICWLSAGVCYAVEKFEILPDLPDPLATAAEASTISNTNELPNVLASQSVGHEPNILSVVLTLFFVILLIYVTGIIYTKLNKVGFKTLRQHQGELAKSQVAVVSTTSLGNNKSLHVVELDGKRMLIGASTGAIQLIKDLGSATEFDSDEEYSHIEIPNIKIPKIEIPKIEIPSIGFSKILTKAHKKLEEESDEEIEDMQTSVQTEDNVSDEVIIDSLFADNNSNVDEIEQSIAVEHKVDPDEYALYKKYLG